MILTKYFITQGFQSQRHTLFKKKKERKQRKEGEKIQISEPNKRDKIFLLRRHITNPFKQKENWS